MKDERVAIFIDGSNFYHALKDNFGRADLDFEVLDSKLRGGRRLIRIYYYNVPVDQRREPQRYADQRKFFARMHQTPCLTLKLGRLVYRGDVPIEKGVDVRLATEMLNLAWKDVYDTAIIVTGDGDFADAVELVKELGKHVENAFTRKGLSQDLYQACDRWATLDEDFLKECWLK